MDWRIAGFLGIAWVLGVGYWVSGAMNDDAVYVLGAGCRVLGAGSIARCL